MNSDTRASGAAGAPHRFRYYDLVMAAFVTVLICSNVIGATKLFTVFGRSFTAGVLFFPISYVFGDMLTEVYGYARARRVTWAGFGAMIFVSFMSAFIVWLPPAPGWDGQASFAAIFGQIPRMVAASLLAFWVGEFANAYVVARMKVWSEGRNMWLRFLTSTVVAQALDSALFYPLAFYGVWPDSLLREVTLMNFAVKVGWEAMLLPVTVPMVNWLKRVERQDHFDRQTDFNPFTLRTE
jgi:uncharacterized integral membrane protein (TIGR00697 family)